jgi:hypothetical protein
VCGTCVEQNPEYLRQCSSLAQVESMQTVNSRGRVYKRQFERFLDDYGLTNTHAMAVVGGPNMCGVSV